MNPSNQNFVDIVNDGNSVDKTMLIDVTNLYLGSPTSKFICTSCPRRFCKSIAEDMFVAYYSKGAYSKDLFSKFMIAKTTNFAKNLNKFNVIYIDLNLLYIKWKSKPETERPKFVVHLVNQLVYNEFNDEFKDIDFSGDTTIAECILKAYSKKKETFIIIIDEYDVLVRERVSEDELEIYRALLNSLFKSSELKSAISLAYLTGILPIMKDKIQSKLNTFRPFTMLNAEKFAEFIGFTTEEVQNIRKNMILISICVKTGMTAIELTE